jgi:hypothetical protein
LKDFKIEKLEQLFKDLGMPETKVTDCKPDYDEDEEAAEIEAKLEEAAAEAKAVVEITGKAPLEAKSLEE